MKKPPSVAWPPFSAQWLHLLLLGLLVTLFSITQDSCNDVWGHALHGRIMWEKGRLPLFSDYSFVTNADIRTEDNSIHELLVYFLLSYLGYGGLVLLKWAAVGTISIFTFLWLREEKVRLPLACLGVAAVLLVAERRFFPRSDMVNMMFAPLYLYILVRHQNRRDRAIWLLPFLQWIWIQFHSFASLGLFLIFAFSFQKTCELWAPGAASSDQRQKAASILRRLLIVGLLCLLASLATSACFHKLTQPFVLLGKVTETSLYTATAETQPIISLEQGSGSISFALLLRYLIPLIFFLLAFDRQRVSTSLDHLWIIVPLCLVTARFQRLLGLYAVIIVPLIFIHLSRRMNRSSDIRPEAEKRMALGSLCIVALMIGLVGSNQLYAMEGRLQKCQPTLSPILKPVRGVEFLKSRLFDGNVYANYNIGGFVGYHLYPRNKIFIHSLIFWYRPEHYLLSQRVWRGEINPGRFADQYQIQVFLLLHHDENDLRLSQTLQSSPQWALVYLDETTVVYARRTLLGSDASRLHAVDLKNLSPGQFEFLSPYGPYWVGNFLVAQQHWPSAKSFYEMALSEGIEPAFCYNNLAIIEAHAGQLQTAMNYFVLSMTINPTEMTLKNLRNFLSKLPPSARQGELYAKALGIAHP